MSTSPTSPVSPFPSPTEQRSKAPEFYGFVAWTSTYILFVLYILWALLPDEYIQWTGVTWYPSREWSILLPAYSIILVLLTYFVYFALALYGTPSFDSLSSMTGTRSHYPKVPPGVPPHVAYARAVLDNKTIPELYDIPIGVVNRVLYGPDPEEPSSPNSNAT